MTQSKKKTLAADDWIKAAFRALSTGGVQAIRAEAIARELKTTKGSFYWHFRDVAALKEAMLETWCQRATEDIINANQQPGIDAQERLRGLIMLVTDTRSVAYGGIRAEAAIREWARYDEKVAQTARLVDERRLEYLASIAGDLGYDASAATVMAQLLYGSLIGLEYLQSQDLATASSALQVLGDLISMTHRQKGDSVTN